MVLEVNNTFGERRLYLLKAEEKAINESVPDGFEAPAKATKFTNAWDKDFHVSPFNSRKGTYSLTAADPVANLKTGSKILDNIVVLNSSKAHAKLVARVYSDGDHMNPATMSTSQVVRLLISWFWVGFLTFPRIIAQAYKLYFKRKLHVWFRPEVLASSIGRTHTSSEAIMEAYFLAYLSYLVDAASSPLSVTYTPAGGLGHPTVLTSKNITQHQESKELTLRVLTPAFYTRYAHYAHTTEAFDRESLHTSPQNQTLVIENPEHLPILLGSVASSSPVTTNLSTLDQWRWRLLQRLRSPPPATAYPDTHTELHDLASVSDIRRLPLSPLDKFVLFEFNNDRKYANIAATQLSKHEPTSFPPSSSVSLRDVYRNTVMKVFIADTYLLGFEGLIGVSDVFVRVLLVVVWFKWFSGGDVESRGVGGMMGRWIGLNILHLWDAVKSI